MSMPKYNVTTEAPTSANDIQITVVPGLSPGEVAIEATRDGLVQTIAVIRQDGIYIVEYVADEIGFAMDGQQVALIDA